MLLIHMIHHTEICFHLIGEDDRINWAYSLKNMYLDFFQKYKNCALVLGLDTRT